MSVKPLKKATKLNTLHTYTHYKLHQMEVFCKYKCVYKYKQIEIDRREEFICCQSVIFHTVHTLRVVGNLEPIPGRVHPSHLHLWAI